MASRKSFDPALIRRLATLALSRPSIDFFAGRYIVRSDPTGSAEECAADEETGGWYDELGCCGAAYAWRAEYWITGCEAVGVACCGTAVMYPGVVSTSPTGGIAVPDGSAESGASGSARAALLFGSTLRSSGERSPLDRDHRRLRKCSSQEIGRSASRQRRGLVSLSGVPVRMCSRNRECGLCCSVPCAEIHLINTFRQSPEARLRFTGVLRIRFVWRMGFRYSLFGGFN